MNGNLHETRVVKEWDAIECHRRWALLCPLAINVTFQKVLFILQRYGDKLGRIMDDPHQLSTLNLITIQQRWWWWWWRVISLSSVCGWAGKWEKQGKGGSVGLGMGGGCLAGSWVLNSLGKRVGGGKGWRWIKMLIDGRTWSAGSNCTSFSQRLCVLINRQH